MLRAGGRSAIAWSGGGKSGGLRRRMGLDFRLHSQFEPFTGHGQSRISEGHFACVDPMSIGSVLQGVERLGEFLPKPFLHLIDQHVAIHG